jgi:hypothetical protein
VRNEEFAMFLPSTSEQASSPFSSRVGGQLFFLNALRLHPRLDGAQRDLIRWDNLDN